MLLLIYIVTKREYTSGKEAESMVRRLQSYQLLFSISGIFYIFLRDGGLCPVRLTLMMECYCLRDTWHVTDRISNKPKNVDSSHGW